MMSDNNDDDNDFDFEDDDESFESFDDESEGGNKTLGQVIQDNPLAKIGLVLGGVILLITVVVLFGGSGERDPSSLVSGGSSVTSPPATEEASPAYIEAIQDVNEQNREQAQREGGSALPIPVETPIGVVNAPLDDDSEEDPLQRWRRLQEERLQRELDRQEVIRPSDVEAGNAQADAIQRLADLMAAQMQSILEQDQTTELVYREVTPDDLMERIAEKERQRLEALRQERISALDQDGDGIPDQANTPEEIVIPAGEIEYAQLLIQANSDVEGPVLAMLVSGPLRGSKLIGDFETTDTELLTLNFNRVIVDGIDYGIEAIALDPDTSLPGMATEVDRRWLQRIIIPVAAAFVQGAADTIADAGRTDVSVEGDAVVSETEDADLREEVSGGVEEAGQEFRTILEELNEDTEPLIIIEAGTPMGILFLQAVTQPVDPDDL